MFMPDLSHLHALEGIPRAGAGSRLQAPGIRRSPGAAEGGTAARYATPMRARFGFAKQGAKKATFQGDDI